MVTMWALKNVARAWVVTQGLRVIEKIIVSLVYTGFHNPLTRTTVLFAQGSLFHSISSYTNIVTRKVSPELGHYCKQT